MNRKYTTEEYIRVVKRLREVYPDVAITTDVIVGFPGESEEEFKCTVDFIKSVDFSAMHVFKFSAKEGTPAAKYKDQVAPNIKEQRSKVITAIAIERKMAFENKFLNKTMDVLFEFMIDAQNNIYEGHTDNYIRVFAVSEQNIKGMILPVELKAINEDYVEGKLVIK
jgi:threonylcarbamoyladenosine tRNA methylthiotransferase MtaB